MRSEVEAEIRTSYEGYLQAKEDNVAERILRDMRLHVIHLIVSEDRNMLTNKTFLSLIEDEKKLLLSGAAEPFTMSGLVGVTKAFRKKEGYEDISNEEIFELIRLENPRNQLGIKMYLEPFYWFVEIFLNQDGLTESNYFLMEYLQRKREEFPNVFEELRKERPNFIEAHVRIEAGVNSVLHRQMNNLDGQLGPISILMTKTKQKRAFLMAVLNYSIGDILNAKFFLMKGMQINVGEFELSLLLNFLDKAILVNK